MPDDARQEVWQAIYDAGCDYDAGCHSPRKAPNGKLVWDDVCRACSAAADSLVGNLIAAIRAERDAEVAALVEAAYDATSRAEGRLLMGIQFLNEVATDPSAWLDESMEALGKALEALARLRQSTVMVRR